MLVAPIRGYWILNPQRSGKFIFLKVVNWFSLFKQVDKLYLLDKTQRFRPLLKQKKHKRAIWLPYCFTSSLMDVGIMQVQLLIRVFILRCYV
uniref:Uncharacterized protein n=1 Tax=Trichobilharzia regenti TaxID=157069 RepID=A0AA85IT24_TRIRE|nr:unnamed protein product [Trichobilharzia regenti]